MDSVARTRASGESVLYVVFQSEEDISDEQFRDSNWLEGFNWNFFVGDSKERVGAIRMKRKECLWERY